MGRKFGEAWGRNQIKEKSGQEEQDQERETLSRVEHQVRFRLHPDLLSFVYPGLSGDVLHYHPRYQTRYREYALRFFNK